MKGLEHLSQEVRLVNLGLLSLKKTRGGFGMSYQSMKVSAGMLQRRWPCSSAELTRSEARGTKTQVVPFEHQETFSSCCESKHRCRLPGEAVEAPSLDILRSPLEVVLGNVFWVTLLERKVGLDDLQRSLVASKIPCVYIKTYSKNKSNLHLTEKN